MVPMGKKIICVDKCIAFGIKKFATRSACFEPKFFINDDPVPFVKQSESFKYLGRFFNYDMENQEHKDHLTSSLLEMLKVIDSLKIHPRNKILLFNQYILSKLSWDLTVANLSKTWVCENLDQLVTKFVRQWLELPISSTLSGIVLSRKHFGLELLLPSVKFQQCQIVLRNSLKSSPNTNKNTKAVLKCVRDEHTEKLKTHLTSQGFIVSFLLEHSYSKLTSLWSAAQSKLPKNIFNFTIRYFKNRLATRNNLCLWKISSFCLQPESLLHVVAG